MEIMKSIYNQMKATETNPSLAETNSNNFETILSILKSELNSKGRKNLIEMLKSLLTLEQMTVIFNKKTKLVEELIKILFEMNESDGFKIMKSFNIFIFNNFKNTWLKI